MNLFTKEKFEYLFQAVVIFLLFSPLYVPFSTKEKEVSNEKALVRIRPTTDFKMALSRDNYILKPMVLADKFLKVEKNSFTFFKLSE